MPGEKRRVIQTSCTIWLQRLYVTTKHCQSMEATLVQPVGVGGVNKVVVSQHLYIFYCRERRVCKLV